MRESKNNVANAIVVGCIIIAIAIFISSKLMSTSIVLSTQNVSNFTVWYLDGNTAYPINDVEYILINGSRYFVINATDKIGALRSYHSVSSTCSGCGNAVMSTVFNGDFDSNYYDFWSSIYGTLDTNAQVNGISTTQTLSAGLFDTKGTLARGTYSDVYAYCSDVYGVYGRARGNIFNAGETCYSIYGTDPVGCDTSWSGYFEGDINVGSEAVVDKLTASSIDPEDISFTHANRKDIIERYSKWTCQGTNLTVIYYNNENGVLEEYKVHEGRIYNFKTGASIYALPKISINANCMTNYRWDKKTNEVVEYKSPVYEVWKMRPKYYFNHTDGQFYHNETGLSNKEAATFQELKTALK